MSIKTEKEKFATVREKNTYFLRFPDYEIEYEEELNSLKKSVLELKEKIEKRGLNISLIVEYIQHNENGLQVLLSLTGISRETLLRLITLIRDGKLPEINELVKKQSWPDMSGTSEWGIDKIEKLVKNNPDFAEGIVNLLFNSSKFPKIKKIFPLFELKKLDLQKINFSIDSLIDTILRYKSKGSSKAEKGDNSENYIREILDRNNILHTAGKIGKIERTIDVIIPNKENPEVLIEVTFLTTTSSGMGDKAKTETKISKVIATDYPNCDFIGFIDGIGWYVRTGDLERLVSAFKDVFTFDSSELIRFEQYLKNKLSNNCYAKN